MRFVFVECNMSIVFRYYYKFIINGQWRHSTASPIERDEREKVNNVIMIGDIASVKPFVQQQKKVSVLCFGYFYLKKIERYDLVFAHDDISKSVSSVVFIIRFSNILPSIHGFHGFTIGST